MAYPNDRVKRIKSSDATLRNILRAVMLRAKLVVELRRPKLAASSFQTESDDGEFVAAGAGVRVGRSPRSESQAGEAAR